MLPARTATRFIRALREGGSLPGLVEADDEQLWIAKFRGAGQGVGALVAEVIGATLARAAGLPVPDVATLKLPPGFGATEGDPEIQELLMRSEGTNAALRFLDGALGFDPAAVPSLNGELAARIIAFDVLISNVDRTVRNPNLLWIGSELWLIDHGAALYWQHGWNGELGNPRAPLPRLREHVLWPYAQQREQGAAVIASALPNAALAHALAEVPDAWLAENPADAAVRRDCFVKRLAARRDVLNELVQDS